MMDHRTCTTSYFQTTGAIKQEEEIIDYSNYKMPTYLQNTIKQEPQEEESNVVLNLCVRKRPLSPNYTLNYPSPRSSPDTIETPLYYSSPKSLSGGSEASELSNFSDVARDSTSLSPPRKKSARPFKVFPKNPLALTMDMVSPIDPVVEYDSSMPYHEFREKMLSTLRLTNNNRTNQNMRRTQGHTEKVADPTYLERRRKNNEAAKRSRDARRAKEDEIVIRCAFLAQENLKLKSRIAVLESEMDRLRSGAFHH